MLMFVFLIYTSFSGISFSRQGTKNKCAKANENYWSTINAPPPWWGLFSQKKSKMLHDISGKTISVCSIMKKCDFTEQVSFIMVLSALRQAKIWLCVPPDGKANVIKKKSNLSTDADSSTNTFFPLLSPKGMIAL